MSRIKMLSGPRVRGIRPVRKDLPKSQVLNSEWKTEWVREDESGDSEDGEDGEPLCVISESENTLISTVVYPDIIK